MKETIEILSNRAVMKRIKKSKQDFALGRFRTLEEMKKRLHL